MSTPIQWPKRDLTARPPAVLRPLFARIASYRGPIPVDDLRHEIESLHVTAQELGDAIAIDRGRYTRTQVFRSEHVEVLVMAWLPGQRSPIHDHAGSACAVRVVSGSAREWLYALRPDGLVDGNGDRLLYEGGVTSSFDSEIHSLGNAADDAGGAVDASSVLVTIHAYSPPLAPTRKYEDAAARAAR